MAKESSPTRSLWLASGVSLAVIVVGAAIISAPSVVDCLRSESSFGVCLRGKMADAGLVPRTAAIAPGDEAGANGEAGEGTQSATIPETATKSAAPTDATSSAAAVVAPQLGLVRAEPDGSLVIAGSAAPGSTVEIYANDQLIGTATTEPSGDWALVPDAPLKPGGYEIRVVDPKQKKSSAQSVVVAINEDKTSQPLVVATEPGKASEVLQGLSAPTQTAMAPTGAPSQPSGETASPAPATGEGAGPGETAVMSAQTGEAGAGQSAAPAATDSGTTTVTAPTPDTAATTSPATTPEEAPKAEPAPEPTAPSDANTATAVASADSATTTRGSGEDVVGDVANLQKRVDALAATPPTIDAIEIDGDKNYFAGSGTNGATMRVYVDNKFVGDATVENGRWLLETGKVLLDKSQRVRVDQLVTGSAQVAGRAEVEFVFNQPGQPTPQDQGKTAVADAGNIVVPAPDFALGSEPPAAPSPLQTPPAEVAAPSQQAASVAEQAARAQPDATQTAQQAAPANPVNPSGGTVSVPQADFGIDTEKPAPIVVAQAPASSNPGAASGGAASASGSTSGSATPAETTTVPKPDFSVATGVPVVEGGNGAPGTATMTAPADNGASAAASSATAVQTEPAQKSAPAQIAAAPAPAPVQVPVPDFSINTEAPAPIPAVPGGQPASVDAQPTPEATSEVPTMVAEQVGNPEDARFSAGKAIIRRGDNLWTIARRVYGEGLRYTTIYQANRAQIRDPNLIYPGQVFELPHETGAGALNSPGGGN